jgi:hypothetical protein
MTWHIPAGSPLLAETVSAPGSSLRALPFSPLPGADRLDIRDEVR